MKLNELRDNEGARHRKMRVGRGIGSGKGKTAGRGVKGQKARTGVSVNGFEGGQTPLHMRLPKFGFTNIHRRNYVAVNIGTLQSAIDSGKLKADQTIDAALLASSGVVTNPRDGVRILGKGALTSKVTLNVAGVSESAKAAIEKAGGSVSVIVRAPSEMSIKQAEKTKAKKAAKKK